MFDPAPVLSPYFTDVFGIDKVVFEEHGAFDISLVTDLPLFIDPFLLFGSRNPTYQALHEDIVRYVRFLRDRASEQGIDDGLMTHWMTFREVKQTWLGFSVTGNRGSGLGRDFAVKLRDNLTTVFRNFGEETISRGSHLEKLCLIGEGVGRDKISDFTTNLIKRFLASYTQDFARSHVSSALRRRVNVERLRFDYEARRWSGESFELPWHNGDYVLLTPRDLLTRVETWINRCDFLDRIEEIVAALPDEQLRATLNDHFRRQLPDKPTKADRASAASHVVCSCPELADHYIRKQEEAPERATSIAGEHVVKSERRYIEHVRALSRLLAETTDFYRIGTATPADVRARIQCLKDVIETQDGYRYLFDGRRPIERETDLKLILKLTWLGQAGSPKKAEGEPVESTAFKDRLPEFKLGSNSRLRDWLTNLKNASGHPNHETWPSVLVAFTDREAAKLSALLKELGLEGDDSIVLLDARLEGSRQLTGRGDPPEPERETKDMGVVIALAEEFSEAIRFLQAGSPISDTAYGGYDYPFTVGDGGQPYACVARLVGDMGPDPAALATERLIAKWSPEVVAMVGIAGALHGDLRLADVVVANQVDAYFATAKAVPGEGADWSFVHRGIVYQCDHSLVQEVVNFQFAHPEEYAWWRAEGAQDLQASLGEEEWKTLANGGIACREPSVIVAHLASGPVLSAAPAFRTWIRSRDDSIKAIEMEAAGVAHAASRRRNPVRTLVIRGISDLADDRKTGLDAIGGGALRQVAARNAIRLLVALLRAGVVPRRRLPT